MRALRGVVVTVTTFVLLAACGDDRDASLPSTATPVVAPPASTTSWDGEWVALSGIVDGAPIELIAPITLTIDGTQFRGTAACNSYGFTAVVTGDTVEFFDGSVTEIGCEPAGVMVLEQTYLTSIGPTATLSLDGDTLMLSSATATWTFERLPTLDDALLTGTRWTLSELLDEFGASHVVGMDAGFVTFADDGTVTGSTSCRPFTGSWRLDGNRVVVSDVAVTGSCDGVLADVDAALLALLAAGFVPEIDQGVMRAMSDDATGIGFRAG